MRPITSKQQLVDTLISAGYQAEIQEGIPYILGVSYEKADNLIKGLGYKGSYGVKREGVHYEK